MGSLAGWTPERVVNLEAYPIADPDDPARNSLVALAADGIIAVHGGSGTLSEVAFAWQYGRPIVTLKSSGGWAEKLAGLKIDHRRPDAVIAAHDPAQAVRLVAKCIPRSAGELEEV